MFVPTKKEVFYKQKTSSVLYQGDIIGAKEIGLKIEDDNSPDFYMIISANCDLVCNTQRNRLPTFITIVGLLHISIFKKLFYKKFLSYFKDSSKIVSILPIHSFIDFINKKNVDNIIHDKISKYMYLPPDGIVLKDPMIIDFDFIENYNASEIDLFNKLLNGKKLELSSPFREKIALRFCNHYSRIGIDDDELRSKEYKDKIKGKY
ncbi:MAG: hypothetical protein R3E32_23960 [Chitinophagales bacterium]